MRMTNKGLEMVWWTLIAFVLMIVVFLIFYTLMRTGMIHIEGLSGSIFNAPGQFANST